MSSSSETPSPPNSPKIGLVTPNRLRNYHELEMENIQLKQGLSKYQSDIAACHKQINRLESNNRDLIIKIKQITNDQMEKSREMVELETINDELREQLNEAEIKNAELQSMIEIAKPKAEKKSLLKNTISKLVDNTEHANHVERIKELSAENQQLIIQMNELKQQILGENEFHQQIDALQIKLENSLAKQEKQKKQICSLQAKVKTLSEPIKEMQSTKEISTSNNSKQQQPEVEKTTKDTNTENIDDNDDLMDELLALRNQYYNLQREYDDLQDELNESNRNNDHLISQVKVLQETQKTSQVQKIPGDLSHEQLIANLSESRKNNDYLISQNKRLKQKIDELTAQVHSNTHSQKLDELAEMHKQIATMKHVLEEIASKHASSKEKIHFLKKENEELKLLVRTSARQTKLTTSFVPNYQSPSFNYGNAKPPVFAIPRLQDDDELLSILQNENTRLTKNSPSNKEYQTIITDDQDSDEFDEDFEEDLDDKINEKISKIEPDDGQIYLVDHEDLDEVKEEEEEINTDDIEDDIIIQEET